MASCGYDFVRLGISNPASLPSPTTNLFNLRAGTRWDEFDLSVFVNNVFNAHPALTRYQEVQGDPLFRDLTFRPRTVGLTLVYRQ